MLDIGWQEIAIIFVIALIVVGPRDLPKIIRTAGEWMGKVRGYARDFQRTIDEAADYTEINAIKKEIEEANKELSAAKREVDEEAGDMSRMMSDQVKTPEPDAQKTNGEAPAAAADTAVETAENEIKPPTAGNGAGDSPSPTNPQTSS